MNSNLKLANQFGIATACGFGITLNLILISATWVHSNEAHLSPLIILALITGGITVALAVVTFALFVAGALEWAFRWKRVSEAEVDKPT